jgi:hypothetical protein
VNARAAIDLDALLCALILAPQAFSRNRFFQLFEDPPARKVRRRAARVRGIIRQLVGTPGQPGEITGELVLEDGQVLLRYTVDGLGLSRTTALSELEAAALRFALHRASAAPLSERDRELVHSALERLGKTLGVTPAVFGPEPPSSG